MISLKESTAEEEKKQKRREHIFTFRRACRAKIDEANYCYLFDR